MNEPELKLRYFALMAMHEDRRNVQCLMIVERYDDLYALKCTHIHMENIFVHIMHYLEKEMPLGHFESQRMIIV